MVVLFPEFGARTRPQDLWPFLISETGCHGNADIKFCTMSLFNTDTVLCNRSPSHYTIRFFHYVTRSVKIIDLCELVIDHKYLCIYVLLLFSFQAELAQNKNNIDIASY